MSNEPGAVLEIAAGKEAAIVDIDTPEQLAAARRVFTGDRN